MRRGRRKAKELPETVEGPWQLPAGWDWKPLGRLVTRLSEKHLPSKNSDLPFVGMEHIPAHEMRLLGLGRFADMRSAGSAFKRGDILYGRLRPYLNKVWLADRSGACSGELLVLRPQSGVNGRYLAFNLHSQRFVFFASHVVTGDRPRIDFEEMAEFPISVPSFPVQREIVKNVEDLFADINDGERELREACEGIKTYRKALLQSAVTGELTADWRRDNPSHETGVDLLRRILAERRARWQADPKNARKKYVEPAGPQSGTLAPLPAGWVWANLDQIATHETRNGLSIKEALEVTSVRALRLGALARERVDWTQFRFLPRTEDQVAGYIMSEGDLLVSRANGSPDLVGRASLCSDPPSDMIFPDTAIRYRLIGSAGLRAWITMVWNSLYVRAQIRRLTKTTAGILKISQGDISKIAVPLPGTCEIEELVSAVRTRIEDLDLGVTEMGNGKLTQALCQSVLAAAFRGELSA